MMPPVKRKKTVIHVRTSERRAFKRCPQRWQWAYREGLQTKEPSLALWFGSGIHLALAHYYGRKGYRRNLDFVQVWEQWCDEGDPETPIYLPVSEMGDQFVEARELGVAMLRGYHEKWEGDKGWDFIQPEMPFQVRIPLADGSWIEYDGTFDGVFRDKLTKKIKLLETKTAKAVTVRHLSLDDQAGSYWAVAMTILHDKGILKARENIAGIQYNFLRKAMPDTRPRNPEGYYTNKPTKAHYFEQLKGVDNWTDFELSRMKVEELESIAAANHIQVFGEVSKVQPPPLFERDFIKRTVGEQKSQIQKIKNEALWMNAARSGDLPIIKHPSSDCSWDCSFFQMCELHDQGVGWEDYRDSLYVVGDPYADHRKSA